MAKCSPLDTWNKFSTWALSREATLACVHFGQTTPKKEIWTRQSHSSSEWLGKEWTDGLLWCTHYCVWHNPVNWYLLHKSSSTCKVKLIHKIVCIDIWGFIPCLLHSLTEFFFSSWVPDIEDVENGNIICWMVGHTTCNVKWIHNKWDTVKISMCDNFISCCLHSPADFLFSSVLPLEDVKNGNARRVVGHITKEAHSSLQSGQQMIPFTWIFCYWREKHENYVDNQFREW